MKTLLVLGLLLSVYGCSSEVDKCVDSQVAAWKAKKERETQMWKQLREQKQNNPTKSETIELWEVIDEVDARKIEEIEAEARVMCLKLTKVR